MTIRNTQAEGSVAETLERLTPMSCTETDGIAKQNFAAYAASPHSDPVKGGGAEGRLPRHRSENLLLLDQFLTADQLASQSPSATLTKARLHGCPCVELDGWYNPLGELILYHSYIRSARIAGTPSTL
ncbi:hypothetical protein LSCM1_03009 [Leishmania martiniquensis]|uniref:Phosphatidylinositol-specific phospholipase C X domain-containing protein n=1 Tax=Leishmania martiniquensis TaxID=1580590 RepID=A0A836HJM5_9TRYP|nr:hypothetical protein LSCM1_03009 [Leishmania martiniquensis]